MKKIILTSNYARQCENPDAIGISRSHPIWFRGKIMIELAPPWDVVDGAKRGINSREEITKQYIDYLEINEVDPYELIDRLPHNSMLLCYESPNELCHRRILADWIEDKTGFHIPEWKNEKEQAMIDKIKYTNSFFT